MYIKLFKHDISFATLLFKTSIGNFVSACKSLLYDRFAQSFIVFNSESQNILGISIMINFLIFLLIALAEFLGDGGQKS